jgi:PTS system fructose-specific IIA component/PTS system fructose-specific IIC component
LADVFRPEAIIVGLNGRTRQAAVAELVHRLVELGHISEDEAQPVVKDVLAQEKRASTALYDGLAFPHLRTPLAHRFVGVLGIEPAGIPFDAVGGGPVYSIFLLLAPPEDREGLFQILGRIIAIGRDKGRRTQLRGCPTPEAAHHFLLETGRE